MFRSPGLAPGPSDNGPWRRRRLAGGETTMSRRGLCTWAAVALLMAAVPLRAADNELAPEEKANGTVLLFDGKSVSGWLSNRTGRPIPDASAQDGTLNPYQTGGSLVYS